MKIVPIQARLKVIQQWIHPKLNWNTPKVEFYLNYLKIRIYFVLLLLWHYYGEFYQIIFLNYSSGWFALKFNIRKKTKSTHKLPALQICSSINKMAEISVYVKRLHEYCERKSSLRILNILFLAEYNPQDRIFSSCFSSNELELACSCNHGKYQVCSFPPPTPPAT